MTGMYEELFSDQSESPRCIREMYREGVSFALYARPHSEGRVHVFLKINGNDVDHAHGVVAIDDLDEVGDDIIAWLKNDLHI